MEIETLIIILVIILSIIGFAWIIVDYIEKKQLTNDVSTEKIVDTQSNINNILKEENKYKILFEEEQKKVLEIQDKYMSLLESQKKTDFELNRPNAFLIVVFQKLSKLTKSDNYSENMYIEKSILSLESIIISQLEKLLNEEEGTLSFFEKIVRVENIFENQTNINESNMLKILDKLGEEIIQLLRVYKIDNKIILEQLHEVASLLSAASSGSFSFIIPSIGNDFLNDRMEAQFHSVKRGDSIVSIENWGIKVRNRIVYKARVKC